MKRIDERFSKYPKFSNPLILLYSYPLILSSSQITNPRTYLKFVYLCASF